MAKHSCNECGSSDGVEYYEDHTHCFVCEHQRWFKEDSEFERARKMRTASTKHNKTSTYMRHTGQVRELPERKISKATCAKYGVTSSKERDGSTSQHQYPYYDETGDIVGWKVRFCKDKEFMYSGTTSGVLLFGQKECRGYGKYIVVVEGELDALSVAEITSRKYDVVSLRNGADLKGSGPKKELQAQLEFLEGYDNIVLAFDDDKVGRTATSVCQDLFEPGKVRILRSELKDANAMLMAGKSAQWIADFWDARPYTPAGIVASTDTWEHIVEYQKVESVPYPWDGLNRMAKGIITPQLVTITSGSGMGKTQIMKELQYYLLMQTQANLGIIPLEESIARASLGMMSIHTGRLLHLEDNVPQEVMRPAWEQTMGLGRMFLLDHFGSTSVDSIVSRVRYLAKAHECRYVFLDHLSIVVSAQEDGDERKAIDAIMTRLRKLCEECNITLFLVSHLSRAQGVIHEEGGRVTLGQLRGSQAIAQLSDLVLAAERNQQDEDEEARNITLLRIIKNRLTGETGPAVYLKYSRETGRLTECEKPIDDIKEF